MSSLAALERRIAELEDRAAITDLLHRTAELVRAGRMSDGIGLFTPDAVWELHHLDPARPGDSTLQRRFEGAEAILGGFAENAEDGTQVWPMIHNLRIELDGDEARSTSVIFVAVWPHGRQLVGEYRDRFRRSEAGWRFAARTYLLFGDLEGRYAAETQRDYPALAGTPRD